MKDINKPIKPFLKRRRKKVKIQFEVENDGYTE